MSRFSIRRQIFILTVSMIVGLILVSALSWVVQDKLTTALQKDARTVEQEHMILALRDEVIAAEIAVLSFATGDVPAWERFVAHHEKLLSDMDKAISDLPAPVQEQLAPLREQLAAAETHFSDVEDEALFGQMDTLNSALRPVMRSSADAFSQIAAMMSEQTITKRAATQSQALMLETLTKMVIGLALALGIVLSWLVGRSIARLISSAAQTVESLAAERYDCEVSGQDRGDELGSMARSLSTLCDRLEASASANAREQEENALRVDLFHNISAAMSRLKNGKLDARITGETWAKLGEEYLHLCDDFNDLAETLAELVGSLRASVDIVTGNAGDLSDMSGEMSHRAELQAATLEQSAAALDQLSTGIQAAASQAEEANTMVSQGRSHAEEGGTVMARALDAMSSIAKSSEQITQIIDVIDDIAFQTNLLALNAGVEAARAGESGKGFAVVASEVRNLAQRAAESAHEIKELVMSSTAQVEDGEKLVQETSQTLAQIVQSVSDVSERVSAIAAASREQATGVQEINVGVGELDKVTQQNAEMVNETSAASRQLSSEAQRLSELLQRFSGEATSSPPMDISQELSPAVTRPALAEETGDPGAWNSPAASPAPSVPDEDMDGSPDDMNAAIWKDF